MIESQPKFMNGVYSFVGSGYEKLAPVSDKLTYMVPPDKRAQLIFLRVGNSCAEMIYLVFMKDGTPMRYFRSAPRTRCTCPSRSLRTSRRKPSCRCSLRRPRPFKVRW
jgi:hypothetical protein